MTIEHPELMKAVYWALWCAVMAFGLFVHRRRARKARAGTRFTLPARPTLH